MFHKISERITAFAIKNGVLDEQKAEEYIYGLEISFSVTASYLAIILIGSFMGRPLEAILFLLLFTAVRRFSGGFHFKSQIKCFLTSGLLCPAVLLTVRYFPHSAFGYSVVEVISALTILILSPVPAVEKPLDDREISVYGAISRAMIAAISTAYSILCICGRHYTARIIALTLCAVAALEIAGKVKQCMNKNKLSRL